MITLPKARDSLRDLKFEVSGAPEITEPAWIPIERMVARRINGNIVWNADCREATSMPKPLAARPNWRVR